MKMIIFGILDSEMELPMTLKKSTDRLLYLIGMAVTFLGLLIPYAREEDVMLNIFSGASYYNQPGIAYISTFIVIVWLAALVGVILYFVGNFVVVDFIVWLIGAAFGIAHTIAMAMYCYDNDYALFGWIFVGSCLAFVGMTAALVGLILSIKNIQHPLAEKAA